MPEVTSSNLNRQLLQLSVPLAGTQLANIALAATDTAIMGHLGISALAGGGLAVVWFNQIRTMAVGMLTPLGNQISEAHARFEDSVTPLDSAVYRDQIRNLTRAGVLLATVCGAIGAVLLVAISYSLPWFGIAPEISQTAASMMLFLAPGLLPCLWFQVFRQFCVGLREPMSLLRITLAMLVINAALSIALGFGWGPFPNLGVMGVGLATSIVHLLSALAYLRIIQRKPQLHTFLALDFWQSRTSSLLDEMGQTLGKSMSKLTKLGWPVAATYGAEAGMFSVLAMVMGAISAEALAAHNVVYQVTFIVFQFGVGFSHGGSILVSRYWGLADAKLARQVGLRAEAMVAAVVALAAIVFLAVPELALMPFISDSSASSMALASGLLAIGALTEFVDTAQNIAIGALRGIGDTTSGLKASLIGYWIIGLPAALIFAFLLNLGAYGVWWGLSLGLAASAAMLWWAFLKATKPESQSLT